MEKFKMALLNPLLVFRYILDISLPYQDMPYTSTVYTTLIDLFNSIFDFRAYEDRVNLLLHEHEIQVDRLSTGLNDSNKLRTYVQVMNKVSGDLYRLQMAISQSYWRGSDVDKICDNMKRLFLNLEIDTDCIFAELKNNILICDIKDLELISKYFIGQASQNIVESAMNHYLGKTNRKENRNDMSSSIYTHTLNCSTGDHGESILDVYEKSPVKMDRSKEKEGERDLSDNVNDIDKKHGCHLKHPKDTVDDDADLSMAVSVYKDILAKLLLFLNNIDDEEYTFDSIFGKEFKDIKINKKFQKESMWFDPSAWPVKHMRFQSRFLSYLIAWVIKNLHKIANVCFAVNKDGRFIEYETKLEYVENTVIRLSHLISDMLMSRDYSDDLMFFCELQFYIDSDAKDLKKNMKKANNMYDQTELLHIRLKNVRSSDQDVTMDTMIKLAYMMVSYDPKIKGRIEFCRGYKFKDTEFTRDVVEYLGRVIIESRQYYGVPKMFKFYIKAFPLIYSRWKDINENESLAVGMIALKYFAFVVNDKTITRRINKLV